MDNFKDYKDDVIYYYSEVLKIFINRKSYFMKYKHNNDHRYYSIPKPLHVYWDTIRQPLFREKYLEYLSQSNEFYGPDRDLGYYLRKYLKMSKSEIRKHQYLDYLKPHYNEF